jgi:small nuclear ribonucleoprotein (snRNP)-like protein
MSPKPSYSDLVDAVGEPVTVVTRSGHELRGFINEVGAAPRIVMHTEFGDVHFDMEAVVALEPAKQPPSGEDRYRDVVLNVWEIAIDADPFGTAKDRIFELLRDSQLPCLLSDTSIDRSDDDE